MSSTDTRPAAVGCPVHHGYEPFQMKDPFPAYAELRAEQPVMFDERVGLWVVSRYDDIKAVFEDWETFSSENAQAPVRERGAAAKKIMEDGGFTAYSGLSARRPPEHTRIRAVVQKAFTPRRYKALEPFIRQNVVELLEGMLARPEHRGDMVKDLAYDVPTITILTLIGADVSQVDTFKRWSDSRAAMTWGDLSDEEQIPHAHNLVEYWQECLRLVRVAHEEGGDNLTADLVKSQQDGAEISDHEIASVLYSLLFAGHETTTTLISNALRELLARPEQWEQIVEDPKKIPAAIDEVLRYAGSIVGWRRKALQGHRGRRRRYRGRRPAAAPDGLCQPRRGQVRRRRGLRHHPPQRPRAPLLRLRHPLLPGQHARQAPGQNRPRGSGPARPGAAAGEAGGHRLPAKTFPSVSPRPSPSAGRPEKYAKQRIHPVLRRRPRTEARDARRQGRLPGHHDVGRYAGPARLRRHHRAVRRLYGGSRNHAETSTNSWPDWTRRTWPRWTRSQPRSARTSAPARCRRPCASSPSPPTHP